MKPNLRAMQPDPADYLDLVKRAVWRLAGRAPWLHEDLIQDGCVGLVKAAKAYDPASGASFITYATLRIEGEVRDALRRADPLKRRHRRSLRGTAEQYDDFTISLDSVNHEGGAIASTLADPSMPPDDAAIDRTDAQKARRLGRLTSRQAQIIEMYYTRDLGQKQIAYELGINESRVSQLRVDAIRRMRERLVHAVAA